ncbi:cathepsin B-like cysteine proteinase 3 [Trichoplusia ni]|uniref:Cathepsin B-like cysteine proteinase 3 n=1 Tax=Trichoplusia ni TaxID=7111 RepID=A0A7E5W503_TRINI|nr:cathepsin B-like cysteine proteinase 3 [Trichoplusia ni]
MKVNLGTIFLTMLGGAFGTFDKELHAKYLNMPRSEFVEYFNNQNNSWKIGQYSLNITFTPMDYQVPPDFNKNYTLPSLRSFERIDLPIQFDARIKWPHCRTIGEIYNQFDCDSCWAHGAANTASDRICIHAHKQAVLSEQDLECAHPNATICHKGSAWEGFQFWKANGLVTRNCKPYHPENLHQRKCSQICERDNNRRRYLEDKHYAEIVYQIDPRNVNEIKKELFFMGPIEATIYIYQDFYDLKNGYTGGIYEHKFGKHLYLHSVRIIGYGVENGIEFWLVANSWGRSFGENGFFRIKIFQEYMFRSMSSGLPRKV